MGDAGPKSLPIDGTRRFLREALDGFARAALAAAGADDPTCDAATRAMLHASRLGVDSHGIRLLPHYVRAIAGGRVNGRPRISFARSLGATALLDADDAHGALAAFAAMDRAVALARMHGIGAVAIRNSSHFGAAGAYAVAAAEQGLIGLATGHADKVVRLHGGAEPFHGTNPIAVAAPVAGERPWLLDMATSAVPLNRVQLYRSLGIQLPAGVASDVEGNDTRDPQLAAMLAPLGDAFGFKGAALAGLAELLSSALTGMKLGFELLTMNGPDYATPRGLGAFMLAIDPAAFTDAGAFGEATRSYVAAIRTSRALPGGRPMAPGDREWAEADAREIAGIPVDPDTLAEFAALASLYGLDAP